jgi:predicted oxidoreductase
VGEDYNISRRAGKRKGFTAERCRSGGGGTSAFRKVAARNWPAPKLYRVRSQSHATTLPNYGGAWVNAEGRRICCPPLVTGFDTGYLVEQICRQEHKYSWQALNSRIAARELEVAGSEFNDALVARSYLRFVAIALFGNPHLIRELIDRCKDLVVADSVGELVLEMNALNGDSRVREDVLSAEHARSARDVLSRSSRRKDLSSAS